MLVFDFLSAAAVHFPGKEFLAQEERKITFGLMREKAEVLAWGLAAEGLAAGERVGVCMENSPEYVLVYFGSLKAGAVVVPLSEQVTSKGLAYVMNNCQASMLFVDRPVLNHLLGALPGIPSMRKVIVVDKGGFDGKGSEYFPGGFPSGTATFLTLGQILSYGAEREATTPVDERTLAMILYTSGTTGAPKGVMLTHRNLVANADSIVQSLRLTSNDKTTAVLPFYYSYGNSLLTTHAKVGGCLQIERSFVYPNKVLDRMVREDVTGFAGVPTTFSILLNRSDIRKFLFPKLRYVTQAGGAMSSKHAQELARILPGAEIFIMYGQTEASARLTCLDSGDLLRKPGSVGKPIPGARITIRREDSTRCASIEVGEIVAQGDNVMKGYWGDPEGTAKVLQDDGLHTGDMAWMDEEGYLYIAGRKSEMIKSGGHRISPKEIEETILELTGVHEVAVVGEEDEILGESIAAYIVPKERCTMEPRDVQRHCKEQLPAYMVPRKVFFLEELPKTTTGKVKKHELC